MTVLLTRRARAHPLPDLSADRRRHARWMAYLGCAGALGYGAIKVVWALGGTIGIRNPVQYRATENGDGWFRWFFDHWATPILAGLAIVILLGLVYPWGSRRILRPLIRTCGWTGALLMSIAGVAGLILTNRGYAGDLSGDWRGPQTAGTYLFSYPCFLMIGLGLGGAAWLTRRPRSSPIGGPRLHR